MIPLSATTTEVSPAELRTAMARFATGVTVITSTDDAGRPVGTTVSAVTSLSLDPPLVLVCLDRRSQTLSAVRSHGSFAVNVLAAHHEPLSNAFAKSGNDQAWEGADHAHGATGSPLLGDAHVALDCVVDQITEGGDHEIVIGRVVDAHHGSGDAVPLLYYGGRYAGLAGPSEQEAAALRAAQEAEVQAVECELPTTNGHFRLLAHERGPHDLTAALVHGDPGAHPKPVVRAHAACLLGDVLGSLACDCGARLEAAQLAIVEAGAGVLLYTKRSGADAFLCAASAGPDLAVGAGLLRRAGIDPALLLDLKQDQTDKETRQ